MEQGRSTRSRHGLPFLSLALCLFLVGLPCRAQVIPGDNAYADNGAYGGGGTTEDQYGATIPGETLPGETIPGETLPGETIPGETLPGETIPGETIPGETVPGGTIPGVTYPGETIPGTTIPGQTIPGETIPGETLPGETIPGETIPGETIPGETIPGETMPGEKIPGETIPGQTVPGKTIPGVTVPGDTLPESMTPTPAPSPATAPSPSPISSTYTVEWTSPTSYVIHAPPGSPYNFTATFEKIKGGDISAEAIIGIVFGALAGMLVCFLLVCVCYIRQRNINRAKYGPTGMPGGQIEL